MTLAETPERKMLENIFESTVDETTKQYRIRTNDEEHVKQVDYTKQNKSRKA